MEFFSLREGLKAQVMCFVSSKFQFEFLFERVFLLNKSPGL